MFGQWFMGKRLVVAGAMWVMLFVSVAGAADRVSIERIRLAKNPYRMLITVSGEPSYKIIQSDSNEIVIAFRHSRISKNLKTSGDGRPFIESITLERASSEVVSFVVNTKKRLTSVRSAWDRSRRTLVVSLNEAPKSGKGKAEKKQADKVTAEKSLKEAKTGAAETATAHDIPSRQEPAQETGQPGKARFKGVMDDLLIQLKEAPCEKGEVILDAIRDCEKQLWEKAVQTLTAFLESEANSPCGDEALILKAYAFFKAIPEEGDSDRYLKAAELFQNLISFSSNSPYLPYALAGLAKVNLALNNTPEAKGYLKVIHGNHKNYAGMPEVMLELGRIYNATGQSKQAIALFKEAAKRLPSGLRSIDIDIELGRAFYNTQNYAETNSVLKEVIKADAKIVYEKPDILILLGNSCYNTGKTTEAREYLGMVYNLFPQTELNHEYLTKIGDTYRDEKEEEKAIEIYRLVTENYPKTSGFVMSTMRLADLSKEAPEKEKMYQLIINDFPEHELYMIAMMRLAELYDREGEHLKSIETIKKLLEQGAAGALKKEALSLLEKTTISLFKNYLKSNQPAALLTHFEANKDILRGSKNPEFLSLVGTGYFRAHLTGPALDYLQKAYALYGKRGKPADLTMDLAVALQENGKKPEALDAFTTYIALFGESKHASKAYYRRGLIYSEMNKQDKAIENFRLAFDKSGDNNEKIRILISESDAHKSLENYKIVALLLEKAIEILASGPYEDFRSIFLIHRNLGETYMKLKEYVKASEAFSMALKFSDKEKNNADVLFMLGDSYQKSDALLKAVSAFEAVRKSGDLFWGKLADERLREISVSGDLEKT